MEVKLLGRITLSESEELPLKVCSCQHCFDQKTVEYTLLGQDEQMYDADIEIDSLLAKVTNLRRIK